MSILLALLFPLAVQYFKGGWWKLVIPLTILTALIDVVANYSELAILTWDWPRAGETTFSQRLHRLIQDEGWRGNIARPAAAYCNWISPGHI